jgi:hypothetical protein
MAVGNRGPQDVSTILGVLILKGKLSEIGFLKKIKPS